MPNKDTIDMSRDHNRLLLTQVVRKNLSKHTPDAPNSCSITNVSPLVAKQRGP